ncbi:VC0807 family protein [Saccharopolyspora cebuensis]|uniref:VC0807 family protein n=1 Tax=Saccharopolyspora cebuensis TaxID=418759 RepID=A0ABV4CDH3_9PSEU
MNPAWRGQLLPVATDLVLPIALFYGLRAAGFSQLHALLLGAVAPALRLVYGLVVRRRIDRLGAFVLVIIGLSIALIPITGSPRVLLAKDAWVFAACGVAVLLTLFGKPVMFSLARMLSGESTHHDWDERWATSEPFRRVWRRLTVVWGVALLVEAVLQVVLAFTLPIDLVPVLSTAQWVLALLLLQVASQCYVRRPRVAAVLS